MAESEDDPPPGVVRWLISCDETGMHGAQFYGFGSLWMPWQRRGDFAALVQEVREHHGYHTEIKWTKVKPYTADFYHDLVEEFFRTPWLSFHCVLVERQMVRRDLHGGDADLARRKHFTMLITNKVRRALKAHPNREQMFRVWVDPLHSHYSKANEVVQIVSNHVLKAASGREECVDGVYPHRSHDKPSIQLSDLLLGAVWSAFEQSAEAEAKLDLQDWIAWHLGWPSLACDTRPAEKKFNVWVFYDLTRGPRKAKTRPVLLRFPLR